MVLESVPSTQLLFLDLIKGKLSGCNYSSYHGLVFHALTQSDGIGKAGRSWKSRTGDLSFTFALKQDRMRDAAFYSQLVYLTCVSVGEYLLSLSTDLDFRYKWPNDILLCGKKCCGILVQRVDEYILIGVGLNLLSTPDNSEFRATGLEDHGIHAGASSSMTHILEYFKERYNRWLVDGFEEMRAQWMLRARGVDGSISFVSADGKEMSGVFIGLDSVGRMLVARDGARDSKVEAHYWGDIASF